MTKHRLRRSRRHGSYALAINLWHDPEKACPGRDPGWETGFPKKIMPFKNPELQSKRFKTIAL
jgi:hypothetical protein